MANLTSKELTALEEQLNAEAVLVAKYKAMANDSQDPQLSSTLESIASRHQAHYNTLFQFLN